MKKTLTISVLLFCVACSTNSTSVSLDELNRDVGSARSVLKQVEKYNDSLNVALSLFDSKIIELLLLSKDVENPGACAVVGNRYFESVFEDLSLDDVHRVLLMARMDKEEMELVIRQNELFVLNELVFQNSGNDVRLHTVSENVKE